MRFAKRDAANTVADAVATTHAAAAAIAAATATATADAAAAVVVANSEATKVPQEFWKYRNAAATQHALFGRDRARSRRRSLAGRIGGRCGQPALVRGSR